MRATVVMCRIAACVPGRGHYEGETQSNTIVQISDVKEALWIVVEHALA